MESTSHGTTANTRNSFWRAIRSGPGCLLVLFSSGKYSYAASGDERPLKTQTDARCGRQRRRNVKIYFLGGLVSDRFSFASSAFTTLNWFSRPSVSLVVALSRFLAGFIFFWLFKCTARVGNVGWIATIGSWKCVGDVYFVTSFRGFFFWFVGTRVRKIILNARTTDIFTKTSENGWSLKNT